MKIFKLLFLFLLVSNAAFVRAQEADSVDEVTIEDYDDYVDEEDFNNNKKSYFTQFDTLTVPVREFDAEKIDALREDPELSYHYTKAALSLWDRFWIWFREFFGDFFNSVGNVDWINFLIYTIGLIILIYVIIRLLKLDALKVLYGTAEKKKIEHLVIEENIHEMDFEKLIADAIQSKSFRLAVRLYFLYGLKMLADKQYVYWEPGKTNHEYLLELKSGDVKQGFNQLNYYFEYCWYGNFEVKPEMFSRINDLFNQWRTKV